MGQASDQATSHGEAAGSCGLHERWQQQNISWDVSLHNPKLRGLLVSTGRHNT